MAIKAYCMKWHLSKSDAFRDLLVDALSDKIEVELTDIDNWEKSTQPQIFCQIPLPEEVLRDKKSKPIWIPMWDNVWDYPQSWWDALPKHVRIVCFSKELYSRVKAAGLDAIHLTYYKDPLQLPAVSWNKVTIFYWNRTGLLSPEFLLKLCKILKADKLIFRPDIDPGISDEYYFELPSKIGATNIEVIHETDRTNAYKKMSEANIYLSPRKLEGVGMTFIEALSRGMGVIAYDGPTMNEYIEHGTNGYLCSPKTPSSKRIVRGFNKLKRIMFTRGLDYPVTSAQDLHKLTNTDWKVLGNKAKVDHENGYKKWVTDLEKYGAFISNW